MEIKYARYIQFSLLDPDTIRKFCEIPITKANTKNMSDINGTVFDERLGVTGNDRIKGVPKPCVTCGYPVTQCPGHFGYIELVEPCFNYGTLSFVRNILSCVCPE